MALPKIRVVVADDEPLARRGVRQLLAPHADFTVVGESRNGPEMLRALEALAPDLLFLDVQMPEMDGFEVLRARGARQMGAVVFVTAHDRFAVRAFEAHAHATEFWTGARTVAFGITVPHCLQVRASSLSKNRL